LPDYQNRYGQGFYGEFDFVDGNFGGKNDGADESWGRTWITGRPDASAWPPTPSSPSAFPRSMTSRTPAISSSVPALVGASEQCARFLADGPHGQREHCRGAQQRPQQRPFVGRPDE